MDNSALCAPPNLKSIFFGSFHIHIGFFLPLNFDKKMVSKIVTRAFWHQHALFINIHESLINVELIKNREKMALLTASTALKYL